MGGRFAPTSHREGQDIHLDATGTLGERAGGDAAPGTAEDGPVIRLGDGTVLRFPTGWEVFDPHRPDPGVDVRTPRSPADLADALDASGHVGDRHVHVTHPAVAGGSDPVPARGPTTGGTLHVHLDSGLARLRVDGGTVVVHADSVWGNRADVGPGAVVWVNAAPDRKVTTTTRADGCLTLVGQAGSFGYQHVEPGAQVTLAGVTAGWAGLPPGTMTRTPEASPGVATPLPHGRDQRGPHMGPA